MKKRIAQLRRTTTETDIRAALGPAIIPNYEAVLKQMEKQADKLNAEKDTQQASFDKVKAWYRSTDPARTADQKAAVLSQALELELVPAGTVDAGFLKALQTTAHQGDKANSGSFDQLVQSLPN